jgi:glycosyltransferase involved in cell wall biosynthesis
VSDRIEGENYLETSKKTGAFDGLTILIPMWNEEPYIERSVTAALEIGQELIAQGEIDWYEILIVDDASTDGTGKIADELAIENPQIRVIHHSENRRLGGSLKTGFAHARGELVLYTDADLPCDLAELRKASRLLRFYRADILSAYRHDRTAEGPRRTLYSFAYNWLVRFSFGLRVRDVNFAFKLIRRRVIENVELLSEGSFIDVELLVRANRLGYRIIQMGIDYFPRSRGISTLSSWPVVRKIGTEMFTVGRRLRSIRKLPDDVLALPATDIALAPRDRGGTARRGAF